MRPVDTAFTEAAGRYGDLRVGSKSESRALLLMIQGWFSRSRSFRSFSPFGSSPSYTSTFRHRLITALSSCSRRLRRNAVVLMFCQQCPDRARHLVGQCDRDQHSGLSREHARQPRSFRYGFPAQPVQACHCPPIISSLRISDCPDLEMRPSRCLPPDEN